MAKVSFTRHAEDMLKERKFTKEDIISIIGSMTGRKMMNRILKSGMYLKELEKKF